ncbi:PRC-barrel domain-containing protein [Chondromyces crocatus]|uniref:PRC-barrel domain-containing protein n=1 Tax=Chondromyces crocatus TaxID=52 RepID=A0A0K1ECP3_CHOCO|nr:PRC-barrel domain-containing protein [Chondromyces crocatus]AKT38635.1 uncharacterized protein CMC5_027820 [Chondromyces crocatus]
MLDASTVHVAPGRFTQETTRYPEEVRMQSPFEGCIEEGMEVRSVDGEKLGKVIGTQAGSIMVEKGFLFPRDCLVSWSDVTEVRDGTIHVARTKAELGMSRDFDHIGQYVGRKNKDRRAETTRHEDAALGGSRRWF